MEVKCMEFLTFLVEWGTIVASAIIVGATVLGFAAVLKAYISRKSVSAN